MNLKKGGGKMRIVIVDGMGGGVGRTIAEGIKGLGTEADVMVVGTNAAATGNMMRAGVTEAATGENAVIYNAAHADVIVGPMGIVLPNAMCGEISPAMAQAIAASPARKILIPIQSERVHVVGLERKTLAQFVEEAVQVCARWVNGE